MPENEEMKMSKKQKNPERLIDQFKLRFEPNYIAHADEKKPVSFRF